MQVVGLQEAMKFWGLYVVPFHVMQLWFGVEIRPLSIFHSTTWESGCLKGFPWYLIWQIGSSKIARVIWNLLIHSMDKNSSDGVLFLFPVFLSFMCVLKDIAPFQFLWFCETHQLLLKFIYGKTIPMMQKTKLKMSTWFPCISKLLNTVWPVK